MRFVQSDGDPSAPSPRREPATLIGSRTCFALAGCALVATAYGLGAGWLGSLILGLPLGVWLVLAGLGGIGNVSVRNLAPTAAGADPAPLRLISRLLGSAPGVPLREELAFRARDVIQFVRLVLSGPLALAGAAPLERSESRTAPASGRLRIGLDMPRRHADALACALAAERASGLVIDVRRLEESDAGARPLDLDLDALVRSRPSGGSSPSGSAEVVILLPEHRDHPAAWPDWSRRLPLSYASVFPSRIDPAMVSCGRVDLTDGRAAPLLARLAVAASVQARTDARNPFRARDDAAAPQRRGASDTAETVMTRLALTLAPTAPAGRTGNAAGPDYAPGAVAAAARALAAWLVTNDCATLDPQERRHFVETCSRLAGADNESLLQVAAARVGAGADSEAVATIAQVHTLLRASPPAVHVPDPLPSLVAELEQGPPGSLTLGRLVAGIGLLWATATPDNLAYLRDDLADEMRHAARLVGNDPDHKLLLELIALLDRQRPAPRRLPLGEAA